MLPGFAGDSASGSHRVREAGLVRTFPISVLPDISNNTGSVKWQTMQSFSLRSMI